MELGPRDRLSQAFVKEFDRGRTLEGAVRRLRQSRHPPDRRDGHRQAPAVRARAVPEVRQHRSGPRDDSRAAGGPLHDGRRAYGHQRGDAHRRAVRGRRGGVREPQRRQPPGLQLADRVPRVRRPRGPGRRPSTRTGRGPPAAGRECAGARRGAATARPAGVEGHGADCQPARRDADGHGGERGHLPHRRQAHGRHRGRWAACASTRATSSSTIGARRSTPSSSRRSSSSTCSTSRRSFCGRLWSVPNRAAPTSGRIFPERNDDRYLAHSLAYREADGSARIAYLPVTITRWPPAARVYGR